MASVKYEFKNLDTDHEFTGRSIETAIRTKFGKTAYLRYEHNEQYNAQPKIAMVLKRARRNQGASNVIARVAIWETPVAVRDKSLLTARGITQVLSKSVIDGQPLRSYRHASASNTFGGHRCNQDKGERRVVRVRWSPGKECDYMTKAEMNVQRHIHLNMYAKALTDRGYTVTQRTDWSITVTRPQKNPLPAKRR